MSKNCAIRGKVGIITLPSMFNYGNRLQNYAVTKIYNDLGFEADSLEIDTRPNILRALRSFYYRLRGAASSVCPEELMSTRRLDAFNRFNANIPTRRIGLSPNAIVDEYDFFSTGSDQVWNPGYMAYNEDWYLLEFCKPSQRIALAASIGVDEIKPYSGKRIARAVQSYRGLSVRESRAAQIIAENGGKEATVVCDPTLAISAEHWRSIADSRLVPSQPYVFTYLLGGVGAEALDVLERVIKHGDMPVVSLTDRQKSGEPDAGPAEFISLIDHASHVITDSFHAAVFSSILHTPLTIVHREGGASMFSRLETLSHTLNIEEKVYGSPVFELERADDFTGVDEAISREREALLSFLESCLPIAPTNASDSIRG